MSQASSPLTLPLVTAQVSSLQTPGPGSSRSPAREPPSSLQTAGGARPPPATREGGPAPLCKVPSERCRFFLDAVATLGPGRNAASGRVPGDRAGDDRAPPRARGFPGEAKGSGSGPSPVRADHARVTEAAGGRGWGLWPRLSSSEERTGGDAGSDRSSRFPPAVPTGAQPGAGRWWADDRWLGAR